MIINLIIGLLFLIGGIGLLKQGFEDENLTYGIFNGFFGIFFFFVGLLIIASSFINV